MTGLRVGLLCAVLACSVGVPASAFVSDAAAFVGGSVLPASTADAADRSASFAAPRRAVPQLRESTTSLNLFGFGEKKEPAPATPPPKAGPCSTCKNLGAVDCGVCKGTGKDKATGKTSKAGHVSVCECNCEERQVMLWSDGSVSSAKALDW